MRSAGVRLVLAVLVATLAPPAHAEPAACRLTVARESTRFSQAARDALQRCEASVLAGILPHGTDCATESGANTAIAAAAFKLDKRITARCCGADHTCGTADDDTPASIGWTSASCPDVTHRGCTNAVAHPGDIATCIACEGEAAADTIVELAAGRLAGAPTGSTLAACQAAIGQASATFYGKRAKALKRCWQARAAGRHTNPCPSPGDGHATQAIARAAARFTDAVCRACGGADGACGGGDDLTPVAIGFLGSCPALAGADGGSCAAPVATLADLTACVACVSTFAGDCADRLAVPAFAAYPSGCNPPPGTCASGVECTTSLDCPTAMTCRDNGGNTRYCVGAPCGGDGECTGGAICRDYCTFEGCQAPRCQCPGFGCAGPDQLCLAGGGLACHLLCTQDSDCVAPFGGVCVNAGFLDGLCIGTAPCL
jgi:hypothetical protein